MAATMASLLKPSSSYYNYTNQAFNRTRIIIPTATTRISFPINQKFINIPTFTQTPLPKITTATTTTTKCSSSSSSSNNRGSTFREEKEEEDPSIVKEMMLKVVKELEKPALTAILVWVLLTNNPIIVFSSFSRTAIFWKVWFVYDVCKAIASRRRIDDGSSIGISLGPVLGSIMIFPRVLFGFGTMRTSVNGSEITFKH